MRDIVVAIIKAGAGQAAVLICGAITVKLLAVMTGPAGVGLFSLLRQIQQILTAIASLGGQNAVVQGTACYQGADQHRFKETVFWLFAGGITVESLVILAFANPLTVLLLNSQQASFLRWLIVPIAAGVTLIFFRGILNAHMEIGSVALVNIVTATGALLFVYPAVAAYNAGYHEALILILTGSLGIGCLMAIYEATARGCLTDFKLYLRVRLESASVRHCLGVGLPLLAAVFVGMGSLLFIRAVIVRWHDLSFAGQFDAAWAISAMYLTLFLLALQTYLLPTLSGNRDSSKLRDVLHKVMRITVIAVVPLITSLIVMKPFAVRMLYSEAFVPALDLLRWTLLGDYLRVVGWVLATTLVAYADMRAYLMREIAWSVVFVALALWFLPSGIEGAGPAYVAAYGVYLGALLWRAYGTHALVIQSFIVVQWLGGAGVLLLASAITWHDTEVLWYKTGLILLALIYSWLVMAPAERAYLRTQLMRPITTRKCC